MNNLLHANLARIFKSRYFYIGLIFLAGFSLLYVIFANNNGGTMSAVMTAPLLILPMVIAAFVGLLAAPEFTYGTMRNKIIIGHKHGSIYAASLISLSAVSLIYYAVYEVITFAVGVDILDASGMSFKATVASLLIMAILFVSNTALSLLICMLVHGGKSLVLVLIMQYALTLIGVASEEFDNKAIQIVGKFIPQGYLNFINVYTMPDKLWQAVLYPLVLGIAVTLLGIYLFKKSDIK